MKLTKASFILFLLSIVLQLHADKAESGADKKLVKEQDVHLRKSESTINLYSTSIDDPEVYIYDRSQVADPTNFQEVNNTLKQLNTSTDVDIYIAYQYAGVVEKKDILSEVSVNVELPISIKTVANKSKQDLVNEAAEKLGPELVKQLKAAGKRNFVVYSLVIYGEKIPGAKEPKAAFIHNIYNESTWQQYPVEQLRADLVNVSKFNIREGRQGLYNFLNVRSTRLNAIIRGEITPIQELQLAYEVDLNNDKVKRLTWYKEVMAFREAQGTHYKTEADISLLHNENIEVLAFAPVLDNEALADMRMMLKNYKQQTGVSSRLIFTDYNTPQSVINSIREFMKTTDQVVEWIHLNVTSVAFEFADKIQHHLFCSDPIDTSLPWWMRAVDTPAKLMLTGGVQFVVLLSQAGEKVRIPEELYNPDAEHYNPVLGDIMGYLMYGDKPADDLLIPFTKEVTRELRKQWEDKLDKGTSGPYTYKYSESRCYAAFFSGMWNSAVYTVTAIPDLIKLLRDLNCDPHLRQAFADAWSAFRQKADSAGGFMNVVKAMVEDEFYKANPCELSYFIGGRLIDAATFFIIFTKVGRLAQLSRILYLIDPGTYILDPLLKLGAYAVRKGIPCLFRLNKRILVRIGGKGGKIIVELLEATEDAAQGIPIRWQLVERIPIEVTDSKGRVITLSMTRSPLLEDLVKLAKTNGKKFFLETEGDVTEKAIQAIGGKYTGGAITPGGPGGGGITPGGPGGGNSSSGSTALTKIFIRRVVIGVHAETGEELAVYEVHDGTGRKELLVGEEIKEAITEGIYYSSDRMYRMMEKEGKKVWQMGKDIKQPYDQSFTDIDWSAEELLLIKDLSGEEFEVIASEALKRIQQTSPELKIERLVTDADGKIIYDAEGNTLGIIKDADGNEMVVAVRRKKLADVIDFEEASRIRLEIDPATEVDFATPELKVALKRNDQTVGYIRMILNSSEEDFLKNPNKISVSYILSNVSGEEAGTITFTSQFQNLERYIIGANVLQNLPGQLTIKASLSNFSKEAQSRFYGVIGEACKDFCRKRRLESYPNTMIRLTLELPAGESVGREIEHELKYVEKHLAGEASVQGPISIALGKDFKPLHIKERLDKNGREITYEYLTQKIIRMKPDATSQGLYGSRDSRVSFKLFGGRMVSLDRQVGNIEGKAFEHNLESAIKTIKGTGIAQIGSSYFELNTSSNKKVLMGVFVNNDPKLFNQAYGVIGVACKDADAYYSKPWKEMSDGLRIDELVISVPTTKEVLDELDYINGKITTKGPISEMLGDAYEPLNVKPNSKMDNLIDIAYKKKNSEGGNNGSGDGDKGSSGNNTNGNLNLKDQPVHIEESLIGKVDESSEMVLPVYIVEKDASGKIVKKNLMGNITRHYDGTSVSYDFDDPSGKLFEGEIKDMDATFEVLTPSDGRYKVPPGKQLMAGEINLPKELRYKGIGPYLFRDAHSVFMQTGYQIDGLQAHWKTDPVKYKDNPKGMSDNLEKYTNNRTGPKDRKALENTPAWKWANEHGYKEVDDDYFIERMNGNDVEEVEVIFLNKPLDGGGSNNSGNGDGNNRGGKGSNGGGNNGGKKTVYIKEADKMNISSTAPEVTFEIVDAAGAKLGNLTRKNADGILKYYYKPDNGELVDLNISSELISPTDPRNNFSQKLHLYSCTNPIPVDIDVDLDKVIFDIGLAFFGSKVEGIYGYWRKNANRYKTNNGVPSTLADYKMSRQSKPKEQAVFDNRTGQQATEKGFTQVKGEDVFETSKDGEVIEVKAMYTKPGATNPEAANSGKNADVTPKPVRKKIIVPREDMALLASAEKIVTIRLLDAIDKTTLIGKLTRKVEGGGPGVMTFSYTDEVGDVFGKGVTKTIDAKSEPLYVSNIDKAAPVVLSYGQAGVKPEQLDVLGYRIILPKILNERVEGIGEKVFTAGYEYFSKHHTINKFFCNWEHDNDWFREYDGKSVNFSKYYEARNSSSPLKPSEAALIPPTGRWIANVGYTHIFDIWERWYEGKLEEVRILFSKSPNGDVPGLPERNSSGTSSNGNSSVPPTSSVRKEVTIPLSDGSGELIRTVSKNGVVEHLEFEFQPKGKKERIILGVCSVGEIPNSKGDRKLKVLSILYLPECDEGKLQQAVLDASRNYYNKQSFDGIEVEYDRSGETKMPGITMEEVLKGPIGSVTKEFPEIEIGEKHSNQQILFLKEKLKPEMNVSISNEKVYPSHLDENTGVRTEIAEYTINNVETNKPIGLLRMEYTPEIGLYFRYFDDLALSQHVIRQGARLQEENGKKQLFAIFELPPEIQHIKLDAQMFAKAYDFFSKKGTIQIDEIYTGWSADYGNARDIKSYNANLSKGLPYAASQTSIGKEAFKRGYTKVTPKTDANGVTSLRFEKETVFQ